MYSPQTQAALLVYEGFDYTASTSLNTQNGGTGWGEAWRNGDANSSIQSPGLSYEDLPVSGNRVWANSSTYRGLDGTIGGTAGEIWISFIGRVDNATGVGYLGFYRGGDTSSFRVFLVGSAVATSHQWGLLADATSGSQVAATDVAGQTEVFLLTRLDYTTGGQLNAIDLWLDPVLGNQGALGTPDATITSTALGTKDYSFDRVRVFGTSGANADYDELRIGTTFDAVAIPEPSVWALSLGLGAWLIVLFRRRVVNA